jgi:hypothetical protein
VPAASKLASSSQVLIAVGRVHNSKLSENAKRFGTDNHSV